MEDGKIISDFHLKSNVFNNYFANQCSPNNTSSVLPPFQIATTSRIDFVNTSEDKIINIILKLNSKKAHGYDDISIAMLKLCAPAVSKHLNLIFKKCLSEGVFPKAWKFAKVQPIHKKNSRQIKCNYRPISLLPVHGKIWKKLFLMNFTVS